MWKQHKVKLDVLPKTGAKNGSLRENKTSEELSDILLVSLCLCAAAVNPSLL